MVTDPIADMLVRIKNASMVGASSISLPTSKMKVAIATLLQKEGYVAGTGKSKKGNMLQVELAYRADRTPVMTGFKRVSKPSRRMYAGTRDIRPVKRGHGLLVLSTPAGVLTGKEAHTKRVGGEMLFEIW